MGRAHRLGAGGSVVACTRRRPAPQCSRSRRRWMLLPSSTRLPPAGGRPPPQRSFLWRSPGSEGAPTRVSRSDSYCSTPATRPTTTGSGRRSSGRPSTEKTDAGWAPPCPARQITSVPFSKGEEEQVTVNQNWERPGGGFLRILGIVYLIKIIRRRLQRRLNRVDDPGTT